MTLLSKSITQVNTAKMGKLPKMFTGITYTQGRLTPYAVWRDGYIWLYARTEVDAHNGFVNAMRNYQGVR